MREEDELSTKTTPRYKKPAEEDSSSLNTGQVTRHTDSSSHSPSRIYTRRMILLDGWPVWTDDPSGRMIRLQYKSGQCHIQFVH